jgi:hypothetical protein
MQRGVVCAAVHTMHLSDHYVSDTRPVSLAGGGGSPQGLLHLLPGLGLHWYVHSTLTRVAYHVQLPDGKQLAGEGWAHVEKNWGGRWG